MTTEHSGKKTDRRVLRTRKAIMEAFDRLVAHSEYERVTVSAIAREADIDRKTFYLHYSSIDDLAKHKAEAFLENVLLALKEQGSDKTTKERVHVLLAAVNETVLENVNVNEHIVSRLSIEELVDYFLPLLKPAMENTGLHTYLLDHDAQMYRCLRFYVAGALCLYADWLKSDKEAPIETVSEAIEAAIFNGRSN